MVSAFIGWKRVESLMVPWKSKRIKSRHDYRHNLVPVDCFWSFFYVWFYQKINFRTGFWMKICFWKSRPGRSGTVSGALFFQQKKLKNNRFYKVFGVFIVVAYIFISFLLCHFRRNTIKPMVFFTFWWFSGCLFDIIFPSFVQCFFSDGYMLATKKLNIIQVL